MNTELSLFCTAYDEYSNRCPDVGVLEFKHTIWKGTREFIKRTPVADPSDLDAEVWELNAEELSDVMYEYDLYIQNANDEDKYYTGWKPVCISEFYQCEYKKSNDEIEF